MIEFILNQQSIKTDFLSGSTVLDFVRYHKHLTGTKIGCREGDCGACTVLVGDFEADKLVYRSATSCLMPLGNAMGKHIVTVEGINMEQLTPVQQAMVDANGTQCGFCTIGFVVSLTGFVLHQQNKNYTEAIAAIDGNICRCTGYKSIERAAQVLSTHIQDKPQENTLEWLIENHFIPPYFKQIEARLRNLRTQISTQNTNHTNTLLIGGGTDLNVQKPEKIKHTALYHLSDNKQLKGIFADGDNCYIGASVTVSEFAESELMQAAFPNLQKYIKLVSSTPIRNMATMAGNLVNASPIGDMSVFFLALDSSLLLNHNGQKRTIKLRDFYKGYKQLDKDADEFIEQISFKKPNSNTLFNFEKVCKRTHLDIASVNTACQMSLDDANTITQIHLSAGGVAPFPKYLHNTVTYLTGKKIDENTLQKAIEIMQTEVAPISDVRGSSNYKRLLLQQLFKAHFLSIVSCKL